MRGRRKIPLEASGKADQSQGPEKQLWVVSQRDHQLLYLQGPGRSPKRAWPIGNGRDIRRDVKNCPQLLKKNLTLYYGKSQNMRDGNSKINPMYSSLIFNNYQLIADFSNLVSSVPLFVPTHSLVCFEANSRHSFFF